MVLVVYSEMRHYAPLPGCIRESVAAIETASSTGYDSHRRVSLPGAETLPLFISGVSGSDGSLKFHLRFKVAIRVSGLRGGKGLKMGLSFCEKL